MSDYIYLYDSTLRDGSQTFGVDFSTVDKQDIAHELDDIGIDYIEAGWPGSNPTDDAFFADLPKLTQACLTAFGMTRRNSTSVDNDPGLNTLINSGVKSVCIVGKSWDFHVTEALEITFEENLQMIAESIAYIKKKG
jgi:2-isopropylmalate synthase